MARWQRLVSGPHALVRSETDGNAARLLLLCQTLDVQGFWNPTAWPNGSILDHPLIRGLLAEGFAEQPDDIPEDARLDELFAPADLIQIVDADSSQTRVIESVRRGRNLVVQGPPGTGKSQTITNIIAAAVHDGKTVLFMAEKMAALNVVHDRLKKAGLSELCLELHSRQANKRQVLEELARTLAAPAAHAGGDGDAEGLRDLRDRLNAIADVMHRPLGESGLTPYRVLATLVRLEEGGFSPPSIAVEGIGSWTKDRREAALTVADRLARMVDQAGPRSRHPFRGVGNTGLLPMDMPRLKSSLVELQAQVEALSRSAGTVARTLEVQEKATQALAERLAATLDHVAGLEPSSHAFAERLAATPDLARVRAIAEAGRSLRRHLSEAGNVYSAAAYRVPVEHLRQPLAGGLTFFGRWKGSYRAASAELSSLLTGQLPAGAAERIALVDRLIEVQEAARALHAQDGLAVEMLGPLWQRVDTDFDALAAALEWLSAFDPPALSSQPPAAVRLFRVMKPRELRSSPARLRQQAEHIFAQSARRAVDNAEADIGKAFRRGTPDAVDWRCCRTHRGLGWTASRLENGHGYRRPMPQSRSRPCATLARRDGFGSVAPDAAVDTLPTCTACQLL